MQKANFGRCYLEDTFFDFADLTQATCDQTDLWMACLGGATLDRVDWRGANLHGAKLAGATLTHGDLRRTVLVDSDIRGATILKCCVCGLSAWGLVRDAQTCQRDLRVSKKDELPLYVKDTYQSAKALLQDLDQAVIDPALAMEETINAKRERSRHVRILSD